MKNGTLCFSSCLSFVLLLPVCLCAVWSFDCAVPDQQDVCEFVAKDGTLTVRLVNVTFYCKDTLVYTGVHGHKHLHKLSTCIQYVSGISLRSLVIWCVVVKLFLWIIV